MRIVGSDGRDVVEIFASSMSNSRSDPIDTAFRIRFHDRPAQAKNAMKNVAASIDLVEKALKDAAFNPSAWPSALSSIDSFLGSSGVVLLCVDARLKHAPCSANIDEMMEDYIQGGWYARDLRESCIPLLKDQGIVLDSHFQDIRQFERTDYYQDFLHRHGQKWFAGVGTNIVDDLWCLAIQRSRKKEAFQSSDIAKLRIVQTRLAEVARIASGASRAWIAGALQALETIGEAAFVLDWNGKVLHLNQTGDKLVGRFVGRDNKLALPDDDTAKGLSWLLSNKERRLDASHFSSALPFLIGTNLFKLEAVLILSEPAITFSNAAVLGRLVLVRYDMQRSLRNRYGLSDAEIRVALALYKGTSVKEICSELRLSENTVRSHLKKAFHKTGATSQAKLVSLMLSL